MLKYNMSTLYRCRECNELLAITSFDNNPEFQYLPEEDSYKELPLKNKEDALSVHNGHHLEKLKPIKGSMISEQNHCEPVKEVFFAVTNGRERFIMRKWRKNINKPMSYQLIQGALKIIFDSCEVREKEIKKEWLRVMSKSLQETGMIFLSILKEVVTEIMIGKDSRLMFDSSNPLVYYQKLNQRCIRMILKKLKNAVTPTELREIRAFILEQNQVDGVIPLLIRRKFFIKTEDNTTYTETSGVCLPSRIRCIPKIIGPAEHRI